jgi:putative ABC transport system permease protein
MFFLTYLRRELRRRVRPALVTATGLALAIGLVITVTAVSSGVREAQGKVLGALYGLGTDITVTAPTSGGMAPAGPDQLRPGTVSDVLDSASLGTMSASSVTAVARLRGVAATAGALVLTDIRTVIPAADSPPSAFRPPVQTSVIGVDPGHRELGPLAAATPGSGRALAPSDGSSAVAVVDAGYAARTHLAAGSPLTLAGRTFTVVGTVRQAQANPPSVYIPLASAQAIGTAGGRSLAGKVNTIYVTAAGAAAVDRASGEITRLLPSARVTNSASLAKGVTGSLASTATLADRLGRWLAVLVLVTAFAVASLLTLTAVTRRAREFGTLKALGWRTGRIVAQVIGESIATGVAGAVLGIGLGFGGALLAAHTAPTLTATVQESDSGTAAGQFGAGGSIMHATVGGPVQTFANPNATRTVAVPFTAPVTGTTVGSAVGLAVAGALVAGSCGGWRVARLRPAAALSRIV